MDYDFWNPKGGLFWQVPGRLVGGDLGVYGHVGLNHREPADSDYWGVWAGPDDLGAAPRSSRPAARSTSSGGMSSTSEWSSP